MAREYLIAVDLNQNELQNPRIHNLASAPGSPVSGQLYYDTVTNKLYWYNGSGWIDATGGAGGHIVKDNGSARTARSGLNFLNTTSVVLAATDDSGGDETEVTAVTQFGAVTAQTSFGASSGNGSGGVSARNDHVHGTPTHDAAAHSAIKISDLAAPSADVSFGGFKITSLGTPTSGTDAATKAYVDAAAAGIDWKASVRVATTANGTLATAFENGDTIDGITLATGDRILLKDQTAGAENGIYVVAASGAPTRATDADTAAEITAGMAVFVEQGTVNADTGWLLTTDGAITVDTTALVFTQFTSLGQITAGAALTKTGSTLDVAVDTTTIEVSSDALRIAASAAGAGLIGGGASALAVGAGTGITVNANDVAIDTAVVVRKYAVDVGDNSSTSITVTHNLGTKDCVVQVYDLTTPYQEVMVEVRHTTTNTVTLVFAVAPTTAQYRAVVLA